jgi:hypothetical protein
MLWHSSFCEFVNPTSLTELPLCFMAWNLSAANSRPLAERAMPHHLGFNLLDSRSQLPELT